MKLCLFLICGNHNYEIGVVGSRTFNDYNLMCEVLSSCGRFTLISGGATGADSLAERYADEFKLNKIIHIPKWDEYGKSAGFIRNAVIVDGSNIVIAFWNLKSKGTEHTINLCRKNGKEVFIFLFKDD